MLNDFDDRTLPAAARLMNNDDFTTLVAWLMNQSTRIAQEGMKLADIETVRWYQGAFKVLDELIDKLKTARDLADMKRKDLTGGPKSEIV